MTWALLSPVRIFAAAFFAVAGALPAFAMQVQPLALDMVSLGAHTRGAVQVVNDSASALPFEIVIKKLDIAFDGKTSESPAGDEFVVFPPQAVVPAGSTQSFRVQYVGEPDLKKSQSYILYVSQIPVKRKAGESGVQIVFNFGVIVSVAPAGAQSALKFVSAEPATEGGKRGAAVTVENPSTMYSYFGESTLVLESGSWRKSIPTGELRQLVGYGVVLPGKKRRFFVPAEVPAGAGSITASVKYTPQTAK